MTPGGPARLVALGGWLAAATLVSAAVQKPAALSGLDIASFDRTVRPQDDLYRYANASWLDTVVIADDRTIETALSGLSDQSERDVRAIIERLGAQPNRRPGSPNQQVVDLYESMLNESVIEARGAAPLEPGLRAIDAIDGSRALAERAGILSATTTAGPFVAGVGVHPQDATMGVVNLLQGGLLLERADYLTDDARAREIRNRYRLYLEEIFTRVGRQQAAADATAVLALEITIAQAQVAPGNAANGEMLTLSKMESAMPGFDWIAWAKPQGIDRSMTIFVAQPSFFQAFARMVSTVPFSTWRAWLAARYITALSPYVSMAVGNPRYEFFGRFLAGQQAPRPRWKRAVAVVNAALGDAVGRLYVEEHFPRSARSRVERIANQVVRAYRDAVSGLDWPTTNAKAEAQSAIARVATRVGFPDVWRDYRGLAIDRDDLLGNILRIHKFEAERRLAQGGRPAAAGQWPLSPQTANAFYSPASHEVVLPAAILKPPYFDPTADEAVNYGAIGAVIGHEIGHALDDSTLRIPAGFSVEAFNDVTGLTVAFRAYRASLNGQSGPVLDGLSGDQRFLLGWARIWREKVRPEYARQLALSGAYPSGARRVNGAVGHLDAFYEAFRVAASDAMFIPRERRIR
jgi:predicted metalloendopeptidase